MAKKSLHGKHPAVLPYIIGTMDPSLQASYIGIINPAHVKLIRIRKPSPDES